MGEFHDNSGTHQVGVVHRVTKLGAQHHQQRAEPLATGRNDVVGRLSHEGGVSAGLTTQLVLNEGKFGAHQIGELAAGAIRHSSPLPTKRSPGTRPAVASTWPGHLSLYWLDGARVLPKCRCHGLQM